MDDFDRWAEAVQRAVYEHLNRRLEAYAARCIDEPVVEIVVPFDDDWLRCD